MKTLSKAQILLLQEDLVSESGGEPGLHDEGLLESALETPFQTFDCVELYPSVIEKAARLGFGLVRNHAFQDGNKRIGTHAMLVLLALNGLTLEYEDENLVAMIIELAAGGANYQHLLDWVRTHLA